MIQLDCFLCSKPLSNEFSQNEDNYILKCLHCLSTIYSSSTVMNSKIHLVFRRENDAPFQYVVECPSGYIFVTYYSKPNYDAPYTYIRFKSESQIEFDYSVNVPLELNAIEEKIKLLLTFQ